MTKLIVTWIKTLTFLTMCVNECFASQPATIPVQAFVGGNVLLPCDCKKGYTFFWQTKKDKEDIIIKHGENDSLSHAEYTNRISISPHKEKGNCSIRLFRVTVADQREYTCFVKTKPLRQWSTNLKVVANYSSVKCTFNKTVYHCNASGGYPEGNIYWEQDNQRTVNHTTFSSHADTSSLLYTLRSTLEVSNTTSVKCVVEKPGQIIIANCSEDLVPSHHHHDYHVPDYHVPESKNNSVVMGLCVIITLAVVLSVVLVLLHCRKRESNTSNTWNAEDGEEEAEGLNMENRN